MTDPTLSIKNTITISKPELAKIIKNLQTASFTTIGPVREKFDIKFKEISGFDQLAVSITTSTDNGKFRIQEDSSSNYFDYTFGSDTWKKWLTPSKHPIFSANKSDDGWKISFPDHDPQKLAFIGIRSCEVRGIDLLDRVYIQENNVDPGYKSRRENLFILSINCSVPDTTCFCTSLGTGPEVESGYDLNLTELDDCFVINIGSEIGKSMLASVDYSLADGFATQLAEEKISQAKELIQRHIDIKPIPAAIIDKLDDQHWDTIAARCLSCSSCTQVCPTCFCWTVTDDFLFTGNYTERTKTWDSCFNKEHSYHAGGHNRPSIKSRYRQWLSHKFSTWIDQFDSLGCVGCGRCITWCPAGIDILEELEHIKEETPA